jgi:hypothetical protein
LLPLAIKDIERLRAENVALKHEIEQLKAARDYWQSMYETTISMKDETDKTNAALLECVEFYAENETNVLTTKYGRHARECLQQIEGGRDDA